MKKTAESILLTLSLVCIGLLPNVQAVSPPPDGGYPGGNTAEGQDALLSLTSGLYNTAIGFLSLRSNKTGLFNTAIGAGTLLVNTADENTAIGAGTLLSNTTGAQNTATGESALFFNTTGNGNTANGVQALAFNTTGNFNTGNGFGALSSNTTGSGNTADGAGALSSNTTGIGNVALGINAGSNVTFSNNVICIGANVDGANVDNSCFIGNIFNATSSGGTAVFINADGQLGTTTSSRRFKDDIKPMERTSETLFALKPVTFRYKKGIDPQRIPQFGLVAEDVEEVNPDLVVRDKEGKVNTVRYDAVNAMLLNEFLKEHQKVEDQDLKLKEQQATIAQLRKELQTTGAQQQKQIEALAAGLQKVSAQMGLSKGAPQTVSNNK
jgi:endosialidase-like protein